MKVLVGAIAVAVLAGVGSYLSDDGGTGKISGEAVYVSEGCIHCHSQYSRPHELDTEICGPATTLPLAEGRAVLIGNRRQGPDLSRVGLRRSRVWNRAHLIDPQLVTPGTRMPSYRHLFEGDGQRGEALLDYLEGLGTDAADDWWRQRDTWAMTEDAVGDAAEGAALFGWLCVNCHGAAGQGDGILATRFSPSPARLADGAAYRFVPLTMEKAERRSGLATVVKYGILGTGMAGHEYLTDEQIADLVAYLIELSGESKK